MSERWNLHNFLITVYAKQNATKFALLFGGLAALSFFIGSLTVTMFCIILAGVFYYRGNSEEIDRRLNQ